MPPSVALESTVFAHGLPHPTGVEIALDLERRVRREGGSPRTVGIVNGTPHIGLSEAQIRHLATAADVRKTSLRDLPVVAAQSGDGATTVAGTMHLAHRAGLSVMATGGIGGVHRTVGKTAAWDVSADLEALRRFPMTVVCSGPKVILDLSATREVLESYGVTVVGYRTDVMPVFYSRASDLSVDIRCETPGEVGDVIQARSQLGLDGAVLVTVPPPSEATLSRAELSPAIEQALADAADRSLQAAEITPFLLKHLRKHVGSRVVETNGALLRRNATVAVRIASALT
ncbi:MAG: pseudouridine-5-phosphate glycosidase [Bacteroidetes bacterium SW_9_63_38]|nr:MAG: pseudouridine-5-phosphate glycosidase [Bacteroidetes bacterium SW_9_63_38]